MATYKFLVSRTLTAVISITADDIDEAEAFASDCVQAMLNSDFDERSEESINLMEGPENERFSGLKIV